MSKLTTVPDIEVMTDEVFIKHMALRHADDVDSGLAKHPHIVEAWVTPYRAFHDKLHELATPGKYEHEHI